VNRVTQQQHFDAIVIGVGGVGSAAAFHLARRGAKVLGLDRFPPGHDRGSSHGRSRIIRLAYFEHPDYVPLLRRAYELWAELEHLSGEKLYEETGLLQMGPTDGIVVSGVLKSAEQHGLDVETLSSAELRQRFPGFQLDDAWQGVLERRAGFLHVERCVQAHWSAAEKLGAKLITGETVVDWWMENNGVVVQTDQYVYTADRLILTAGAWAEKLLADLKLVLEVRRKAQFWFANNDARYQANRGCPAFLFETAGEIIYGFPDVHDWGVKVACHTGGEPVADPLLVDRILRTSDQRQLEQFLDDHLPGVSHRVVHHEVCLYTMTPDENFVVDFHPDFPQVCFAAGLSGHGFKFTSVLGEILADLSLSGRCNLPIRFLSRR
jgi:sarcosine oxidase